MMIIFFHKRFLRDEYKAFLTDFKLFFNYFILNVLFMEGKDNFVNIIFFFLFDGREEFSEISKNYFAFYLKFRIDK